MESPQRNGQWMSRIVGQFEGPLVAYATRLLGGDVNRARDVVQETFMRLWQGSIQDGPDSALNGHLAAWLYRVCRNACTDVRRKERRMTTLIDERQVENGRDEASECSRGTMEDGVSLGVISLVQSLPETQQEALRLKFQGGLSYAEIAQVMEITVNHVGVLIHAAIKTIRERMKSSEANVRAKGDSHEQR
jgi:RNA polymerase sigma-70 factor (ECF subfamily)